jgi:YD repeat-containing protein
MSRLHSAQNPESATVTYTYDNVRNLQTRTDNLGVVTTDAYDALNRLQSTTYSDGATPAVTLATTARAQTRQANSPVSATAIPPPPLRLLT